MGGQLAKLKTDITGCNDTKCRDTIKERIKGKYKANTSKLHDNFKLNNDVKTLKNEITNKNSMLTRAITEHGAAQSKMKAVIYDTKSNKDKLKFFYLISVLHIIILIMILLGYINSHYPRYKVFNNSIVTITVLVIYFIMLATIIINNRNNSNRSKFNYDEHNIPFESDGSCSVNPTAQNEGEQNEDAANKEDVAEFIEKDA
jgi:hypothetical protein